MYGFELEKPELVSAHRTWLKSYNSNSLPAQKTLWSSFFSKYSLENEIQYETVNIKKLVRTGVPYDHRGMVSTSFLFFFFFYFKISIICFIYIIPPLIVDFFTSSPPTFCCFQFWLRVAQAKRTLKFHPDYYKNLLSQIMSSTSKVEIDKDIDRTCSFCSVFHDNPVSKGALRRVLSGKLKKQAHQGPPPLLLFISPSISISP
jgi:hypothetical protein